MRIWILYFICISGMVGCDSSTTNLTDDSVDIIENTDDSNDDSASDTSDDSSDDNTSDTSDDSSDDNTSDTSDTSSDDIDYSLVSCSDDLTSVLALINEKRTQEQTCGDNSYGPVDEITWNTSLTLAAEEHSSNMANYDFFSHTGLDDSTVGDRVTAQGYTWSYVAENIAAGQTTAESVVAAWMESEGHCKNIMSENVTEMGLACSENSNAEYNYYWTQDFAKPR